MAEISALEAKCATCGHHFSHPSLGDFAYGAAVLSTIDGTHFATADAFSSFAQRVAALGGKANLWPVLAELADPVGGRGFTSSIVCPHCRSPALEYWGGNKTGTIDVPEASFSAAARLNDEMLAARIAALQGRLEA